MCDLGITVDNFNPKILYTFEEKFNIKSNVRYHCHDFLSVIYILSGSCMYNISDIPHKVKKGDLLIFNPGVYHGKVLTDESEILEFQAGFQNIHIKGLPPNYLIDNTVSPIVNVSKFEADIIKCCTEIISEQGKHEPGFELILKSLGMKLLAILIRATFDGDALKEKNSLDVKSYDRTAIVNSILEFINYNYMYELSLDIISQNMYLSPMYISKIFKDETGDSPINYLIKLRLNKAKEALLEGQSSIKDIANTVGYSDVYHFSKLFKKYYGCPPSVFKKSN